MTKAEALVTKARDKNILLATAESCTGGLLAGAITDVPGASHVFERGFVTYSNDAKRDMLGVQPATLEATGAVSEDTAREMAAGAALQARAQLAIAITGIAGPGGSDVKPEGRVCFAVYTPMALLSETVEFGALGRDKVRKAACEHALDLLTRALDTL